jgi:hypothetical protein
MAATNAHRYHDDICARNSASGIAGALQPAAATQDACVGMGAEFLTNPQRAQMAPAISAGPCKPRNRITGQGSLNTP